MRDASTATDPTRSYLFVPGDRPERFDKAWDSPADALVLDLEDAVPPARKRAAREAVAAWLHPGRPVWLRLNAAGTPWHADDLALAALPGVAGVMLPKAERIDAALGGWAASRGRPVLALVETARGMARAGALAAHPAVRRLVFGTLDFALELSLDGQPALDPWRAQLARHSRLAGLPPPVDGVCVDPAEGPTSAHAAHARAHGMGAALCIHPRQAGVVNAAFTPDAARRDWARRALAAFEAAQGAAVAVDGRMVDLPVAQQARRVLRAPAGADSLRAA